MEVIGHFSGQGGKIMPNLLGQANYGRLGKTTQKVTLRLT
jgi:hypothetical protein